MKKIFNYVFILLFFVPLITVYNANYRDAKKLLDTHWTEKLAGGDQHGIYVTFKDSFKGNGHIPYGINNGWVAIGYLSLMVFYHKISALLGTPDINTSFIFHGLAYIMFAAFISFLMLYKSSTDQAPQANRKKIIFACVLIWLMMFELSGILKFASIPWSHYASAFAGVTFVWSVYELLLKQKLIFYFLCGFAGLLFFLTRRHEAMAVFVGTACVIAFFVFNVLYHNKLKRTFATYGKRAACLLLGIALGLGFIKGFSNDMPFNAHYSQQRQSNSYIDAYLKVYPETIPVRFIQTFFDPNYYSYGSTYEVRRIFNTPFGMKDFEMPLIFQIPILLFLIPFAFFTLFYLIFKKKFLAKDIPPAIWMFLLCFSSCSVIILGYLSTAVWGGSHLKHGLIREFILAVLLLTAGTGPALFMYYADEFKNKKLTWIIPSVGLIGICIIFGQMILPKTKLFEFSSKHLQEKNNSKYVCDNGTCHINMEFLDQNNNVVIPPFDQMIVNQHCDEGIEGKPLAEGEAGLTRRGNVFDFPIEKCPSPVHIEVYPIFLGYCGSGLPSLRFATCPSKELSPNCKVPGEPDKPI